MKVKIKQVTVIKMDYVGNYLALYAFSNKKEVLWNLGCFLRWC